MSFTITPAFFWETIFTQYLQGRENAKRVQRSTELRKQIRVEETEAAGNLYEGSSKEELH